MPKFKILNCLNKYTQSDGIKFNGRKSEAQDAINVFIKSLIRTSCEKHLRVISTNAIVILRGAPLLYDDVDCMY